MRRAVVRKKMLSPRRASLLPHAGLRVCRLVARARRRQQAAAPVEKPTEKPTGTERLRRAAVQQKMLSPRWASLLPHGGLRGHGAGNRRRHLWRNLLKNLLGRSGCAARWYEKKCYRLEGQVSILWLRVLFLFCWVVAFSSASATLSAHTEHPGQPRVVTPTPRTNSDQPATRPRSYP